MSIAEKLKFLVTPLIALYYFATPSASIAKQPATALPHTMIWAWERPENLTYANPANIGIAAFIRRYRLVGEELLAAERSQILKLPPNAKRIAVIRIEPSGKTAPTYSKCQREKLASQIADISKIRSVSGIQLDFDARISEREFYRQLLQDLRARLGPRYFISMTALASWCLSDNWINELPVDEIVPMLFDMGADSQRIREIISKRKNAFTVPQSKLSFGFSTRELDIIDMLKSSDGQALKNCQRVYIFSPKSWTRASYLGAISGVISDEQAK